MDKQQLLGYFQDHYLSRQDVLYKLPLNISIDSFWQDLVNQRKARATMLPLYSATGQPYWFVTTDKMVKASERLCEEAMKHDSFFDPYRIPLSQALTSALSQEAYFTSFVEGADYPIQAAVDFLRRGSEPENAYEQNIMNNYQAGSYLLSALSIPFDETFVKELAATLSEGQDGYRTTDIPAIPAMEGEPYMVPSAHMLADRMGQFYAFLADVRVHPLIKAAVGQAYILATRPFQEANERLGRLISNAVLLRYGYDFFLDISISAFIARESYRYFKAMREIIRSDNEGDLTYFVEYYLELLVRALDGTRMEEAERLQSQLESERKMALQPLKPTVQYTQPHNYSAEAVARVIDNAETNRDEEDGGYSQQGERGVVNDAIDGTAPDPPVLPDGDASYRSSQSQAGSTQGDCSVRASRKGAPGRKKATSSSGGTCPQLLGMSMDLMTRIGKMLDQGISQFQSVRWAEVNGLTGKEAASECRNMSLMMLVDRTFSEQRYLYMFRFSVEEYQKALSIVSGSIRSEDGETILSTIEQSGIHFNKKAVEYIRYCCSEHIESFYPRELCKWCSLSHVNANTAISILAERGVIQKKPGKGKCSIVMPSVKKNSTVDDYEKAISAIEGLVLSLDDMRTIIRIDTDVDNAGDVREALELTAGASKAIVKQARNLEQSMKDRFTQYMTRLGSRCYHELVCLHGFGDILSHRDNLAKHEIMYFLDSLDRYDPSAWTDCIEAVNEYSFASFLPEVISLAFKEHPAWKAAEEGKYEGQEWKYKSLSAVTSR